MTTGIYRILCEVTNKAYVGQSVNIEHRFKQHQSDFRRGTHDNRYLQAAWLKYGESAFSFSVLEAVEAEMLTARELHWIAELESNNPSKGFNLAIPDLKGGFRFSEETRRKISEAKKGELNPMFGKTAHNRGKKASIETRAKLSAAAKNRRESPEQRARRSIAMKGNPFILRAHAARVKPFAFYKDGEAITGSNLRQFCLANNLPHSSMHYLLTGKRKEYKGYTLHPPTAEIA